MEETSINKEVESARTRWLHASEKASKLALEMYEPGSGYGDPHAEKADNYRVEAVRADAQRLMQEYHDIDRRLMDEKINKLQKSQTIATWASFTVAFVVGVTTIISVIWQLAK